MSHTILRPRGVIPGAVCILALLSVFAVPSLEAQEEEGTAAMVAAGLSQAAGDARNELIRVSMMDNEAGADARSTMVDLARQSQNAMTVARVMGIMVRVANDQPSLVTEVVAVMTDFVNDESYLKRAVTVDALENLPAAGRRIMVPVLAGMARDGGDTASTRLYLRGLWELGAEGLAQIQGMVDEGSLSGDSLQWARVYLREGAGS